MERRAWQAIVHGLAKMFDMTERLTHTGQYLVVFAIIYVCVCVCVCVQHTQTHSSVLVCVLVAQPCPLFVTPWIIAFQLLCPWNSPGKNTGVGCHFLHQGFFLTQGLRIAGIAIPGIAFQADSLPSEPPEKPW